VCVPIALDEVRQRHLVHRPIQQRAYDVTQARRAQPVDDPIADAIDPVMPQHQVPVVRDADVQFQGVGPQAESLRKALQGILTCLVWGPAVADDEELGPRRLRRSPEAAGAAGGQPPDRGDKHHAEHQTSPGDAPPHGRLPVSLPQSAASRPCFESSGAMVYAKPYLVCP
jgi:hypothetical protein